MSGFLSNIKNFKKEHKFLFAALVSSWLLCIFLLLLSTISRHENLIEIIVNNFEGSILFIMPPIFVSVVSFIACKTMPKYPKLTKWISAILNIGLVGYIVLITLFVIFILLNLYITAVHSIDIFNETQ